MGVTLLIERFEKPITFIPAYFSKYEGSGTVVVGTVDRDLRTGSLRNLQAPDSRLGKRVVVLAPRHVGPQINEPFDRMTVNLLLPTIDMLLERPIIADQELVFSLIADCRNSDPYKPIIS